jgi:Uma2 family endonuclease
LTPATAAKRPIWTVDLFRTFLETRPDEERWELIDGVAVMVTPPTVIHQRIASNLDRLLNDALDRFDRSRMAVQRPGLDLLPEIDNSQPEHDVVVLDRRTRRGERYVKRFYLAAEIVSESDAHRDRDGDRTRIEGKRAIYRQHESCLAVLIVEADRHGLQMDVREAGEAWRSLAPENPGDVLDLPAFGLQCRLVDLYDGTELEVEA